MGNRSPDVHAWFDANENSQKELVAGTLVTLADSTSRRPLGRSVPRDDIQGPRGVRHARAGLARPGAETALSNPTGSAAAATTETGQPAARTTHRLRAAQVASAVVLALVSVSCGTENNEAERDNTPTSASPSPSESGSTEAPTSDVPKATGTTITSAPSSYGQVLWGPDRQVVYIWEKEPTATAECYGDCAEAWPPVLTTGEPTAADQVDPGRLGTTTRRDGSTQVTYNGHPLYYYAHEGPGEVECHNITTHGGLWWVVTPAGDRAA